MYVERLEVWHGQRRVEVLARLRGEAKHRIDYRHVIDWLVRKPGAFENYRYREDLFPTSRFRIAYDALREQTPARASREYLRILHLAARENETAVDEALRGLIDREEPIDAEAVEALVRAETQLPPPAEVTIPPADLKAYDALLDIEIGMEVAMEIGMETGSEKEVA